MSDLYQNKYRIPSARLQTWDYGSQGMYFITICTAGRECYFGKIVDTPYAEGDAKHRVSTGVDIDEMALSVIGKMAEKEWIKTPEIRPDMNLELGEFVVMPNHFHGIILIGENPYNIDPRRDAMPRVSDLTTNGTVNIFGPQSKNMASIIRGFKSSVTAYARKEGLEFGWQARFHDHIIRSTDEYRRIATYIINNRAQWRSDKFFRE
jgi:REP-associated tyrosine transposase